MAEMIPDNAIMFSLREYTQSTYHCTKRNQKEVPDGPEPIALNREYPGLLIIRSRIQIGSASIFESKPVDCMSYCSLKPNYYGCMNLCMGN